MDIPEVKQESKNCYIKDKEDLKQEATEPKSKNERQKDRSKSQLSINMSSDSKNRGKSKNKTKNSKDQFELCMNTSESDELEQTTAQTVPPNRETQNFENRDSSAKKKEINPVRVEDRHDIQREGVKVDNNKHLKVEPEQKPVLREEAGKNQITERKEHLDSLKRPSISQNSVSLNDDEDMADNKAKKRLLSSSEDPIKILQNQKESENKKSELKIMQEISEPVARVQQKDERKIVSVKREKSAIQAGLSQR
jgi:hypothetical protein